MDAPPIQYAKTSDGVSIAFWSLGQGPPLVVLPPMTSNVQAEWDVDYRRHTYERLAERATVIRYDPRGLGLSQSDCLDLSLEAGERDLQAVIDHLGLQRFAVYGYTSHSTVSFAYPARHPESVNHLVVTVPPWRAERVRQLDALRTFADEHWEVFSEIQARVVFGWDGPVGGQQAVLLRAAHTPATFFAALDAARAFSPQPFPPAIQAPTLILYALGEEWSIRTARNLASGIAGAHMVGIRGWLSGRNSTETVVTATLDFINTAPAAPGVPIAAPQIDISAVRTIVFTDVEGSTALNERLGDEGAREVLREHERLTREALGAHGGSEVKAMGDGFMVWFPSATRAVECAIALQRAFDERNRNVGAQQPRDDIGSPKTSSVAAPLRAAPEPHLDTLERVRVRIGINAGEPIAEGDDLFGASVIATARIAAAAKGGQILASDVVRQLLAGKGFAFADQGEHALKGFDEPVRLFEVRWQKEVSR